MERITGEKAKMPNGEDTLPEPKGPLQKELREAATPEKVWGALKKAVEAISCLEITTGVTGVTEGGKTIHEDRPSSIRSVQPNRHKIPKGS